MIIIEKIRNDFIFYDYSICIYYDVNKIFKIYYITRKYFFNKNFNFVLSDLHLYISYLSFKLNLLALFFFLVHCKSGILYIKSTH